MGSFNTECAITKQVILNNLDCVIVPIYQSVDYSACSLTKDEYKDPIVFKPRFCSPTDTSFLWTPFSIQLECKHDDCGLFNLNNNDKNVKNLIKLFENLLRLSFVSKDKFNETFDFKTLYDPEKEYSFNELNEIFLEIQSKEDIFINMHDSDPSVITFCPILKETFDYLINFSESIARWDDKEFNQERMFVDWFNKKINNTKAFYKKYLSKHISEEDFKSDFPIFAAAHIVHLSDYETNSYLPFLVGNKTEEKDVSILLKDLNLDINNDKIYKFSEIKHVYEFLKPKLDFLNLNLAMRNLNLKFLPPYYSGQDYSNESGCEFLKMVNHVNQKVNLYILEEEYGKDFKTNIFNTHENEKRLLGFSFNTIQEELKQYPYDLSKDECTNVIQSLYNKGLITYPFSDSVYFPEHLINDRISTLHTIYHNLNNETDLIAIKSDINTDFISEAWCDEKAGQHFPIMPTVNFITSLDLSEKEKEVYKLICVRYITQFLS